MFVIEPSARFLDKLRAFLAVAFLSALSRMLKEYFTFKGLHVRVPRGCFAPIFVSTSLVYEFSSRLARGRLGCEVGTGAGSLALAVAKELSCEVVGTDLDENCVRAAATNAVLNGLDHLFHPVVCPEARCLRSEVFDFVLVNPPYFPIPQLGPLGSAACAGSDLRAFKAMLSDALRVLRRRGVLLFTSSSLTGRVSGARVVASRWALFDWVRLHCLVKPG